MKDAHKTKEELRIEQIICYQKALLELAKMDFSDLESGLKKLAEVDAKTLGVERVSVWFFNDDNSKIICKCLYKLSKDSLEKGLELKAKDYPRYFKALRKSRTIAASNARSDPRTDEFLDNYLEPFGITSMMDIPIRLLGRVVGILCHEHVGEQREWSLDDQEFAVSITDMISLVLAAEKRKLAERALRNSEQKYRALVNDASDAILLFNIKGSILEVNKRAEQLFGYDKQELLDMNLAKLHPKEERRRVKAAFKKVAQQGRGSLSDVALVRKDGEKIIADITASVIEFADKKVLQGIFRDTTERSKMEEELRENEKRFRDIANNALSWIWEVDIKGKYTYSSPVVEKILGYNPAEILKKHFYDLFVPEEREKLKKAAFKVFRKRQPLQQFINRNLNKNGQVVWLSTSGVPMFDKKDKFIGYRGVDKDITEIKVAEEKLAALNKELVKTNNRLKEIALRDMLTGLFNIRYLQEVIEPEFYRAQRYAHPLSLIMINIDYFKSINDVYGRAFGDSVLKQFAQLLKNTVRKYDIVIRYSGQEFVILSPSTDRDKALTVADRILEAVRLKNFGDKKNSVKLKLSIAIASYPEDHVMKGSDLSELSYHILGKVKEDGGDKVYSNLDLEDKNKSTEPAVAASEDVKLLKQKLDKLTAQANQSLIEAILAFGKTIELKDHYTGEHVERTVRYATEIANALGLNKQQIERIKKAAMLHDLGKVGISDKILLKKSKLTKKEYDIIRKHPQIAIDILRPIQFLHDIVPLIFYHHERWDGRGYPVGLKGKEIPLGARIIALADVYQALISDRPYRKAYTKKDVVKILKRESGTKFDPKIVDAFLKLLKKEK